MTQKCIICGNTKFKHILRISNAPVCVSKLLNKDDIKKDKKITLDLIMCTKCKLVQLQKNNFTESGFYDDYYMTVSYSPYMQTYQRWLAKDFIKTFNLKGKLALEVGCGDGLFASFLNKYGLKTIGVEPSHKFYVLAKKKIKVLNEYLNRDTSLKHHHYDAFVARQVFEHLSNPNKILENIKLYLKPNGVGLIEVPSFTTAINKNRYYDIFRDHIAYYTEYTLQYLLTQNNFRLIKLFHAADNEYLTAYVQNNNYFDSKLQSFEENYSKYKKVVKNLLKTYNNKNVAVWGAGGKGISLLANCNISPRNILFVIDSDSYKHNKYTPGSHIIIKSPQEVDFEALDLIIISAVMYQNEIIRDLKTKYHYHNKIALITPFPHIL